MIAFFFFFFFFSLLSFTHPVFYKSTTLSTTSQTNLCLLQDFLMRRSSYIKCLLQDAMRIIEMATLVFINGPVG